MFEFRNPEAFYLLLIIPLLILYYFKISLKSSPTIKFSSIKKIKNIKPSGFIKFRHIPFYLRLLAIIFFIFALARPQEGKKGSEITSEGIDIMLVIDISESMKAEDFHPVNRLEAAKRVIRKFIKKRISDRIGLVVFGSESFLQCPLTLDHGVLLDFLKRVDFDKDISSSTAIGMAIGTAVNSLKKTKAKSKVIILLTDGANNSGDIEPSTAANLANTFDIKIYSIGIGKPGISKVPVTVNHPIFGKRTMLMQAEMDEDTLKEISKITGGIYFNAQNTSKLAAVYNRINKLEKTKIKTKQYLEYNEKFFIYVIMGFIFLLLEIILKNTRFRKLP